jgi:hypothetical protein
MEDARETRRKRAESSAKALRPSRLRVDKVPAGILFLVVLDFHGFKVFGFEDLAAIQTFDVIDAVSAGDDLGAVMVTNGQHKTQRFR